MNRLRYRIFVVFHETLFLHYYDESLLEHIVFVNVNPQNKNYYPNLTVINLYEFQHFMPLGKWYTESEVIYNVFKNTDHLEGFDFIGFLHYDIDTTLLTHEKLLASIALYDLIAFDPHLFSQDYQQKILMDDTLPNQLHGEGKNCYLGIFEDVNHFYQTNYEVNDWIDCTIGLCSCFLVKRSIFESMMIFISTIIESKKLDTYDTTHSYRIQGGLLERYYAVWFLLKKIPVCFLKLNHYYAETKRQNTIAKRIVRKMHEFWSSIKK